MRKRLALIGLAAVLFVPQSSEAADIIYACADDVADYCDAVDPGYGRLLACLYGHETVISQECAVAMADTADLIDLFFERVRYVSQECGDDIRSLCGDVPVGQGRIFTCLSESRSELSESCLGVIDQVELPQN